MTDRADGPGDDSAEMMRGFAVIDLLLCTCSHHVEEHEPVGTGAGGCEIEDCPCIQFEADEELTVETYDL